MSSTPYDRRWSILAILTISMFMVMLDATVVNIAIAHIMGHFDTGVSSVQWIVNAYVLVLACSLITFGRLGDLVGRKRIFLTGLAFFTAASLACAFAPGIGWLVGLRAVQGLGGAMMLPSTLSIATVVFPPAERGKAIGIWAGVNGLATAAGPTLGGLIIDRASWSTLFDGASWPYVFLVNVPVGLALLVAGLRLMPESTDRSAGRRLDVTGVVLLTAALVCLTWALIEGEDAGWTSVPIVSLFVAAVVGLLAFVAVERRVAEPLLPLSAFRSRTFTGANLTGLIMSFGLAGGLFLLPLFFQLVFGYSAVKTGLLLTPLSGGLFLGAPIAGRLTDRLGPRWLAFGGMLVAATGFVWLQAPLAPGVGWRALVGPLLVAGFGIGFVVAPIATAIMGSSPEGAVGASSGIYSTMRQFGALLGVAVMGSLLQNRAALYIADAVAARMGAVPGVPDDLALRLAGAIGEAGKSLGGDAALPADVVRDLASLPPGTAAAVERVATQPQLLLGGVVEAMQVTIAVSAGVLVGGALLALLIGRPATATTAVPTETAAESAETTAVPSAAPSCPAGAVGEEPGGHALIT